MEHLFCMRSEWNPGKVFLHTKKPRRLGSKGTPEKNWSTCGDECIGYCEAPAFEALMGKKIEPGTYIVRFPSGQWSDELKKGG